MNERGWQELYNCFPCYSHLQLSPPLPPNDNNRWVEWQNTYCSSTPGLTLQTLKENNQPASKQLKGWSSRPPTEINLWWQSSELHSTIQAVANTESSYDIQDLLYPSQIIWEKGNARGLQHLLEERSVDELGRFWASRICNWILLFTAWKQVPIFSSAGHTWAENEMQDMGCSHLSQVPQIRKRKVSL